MQPTYSVQVDAKGYVLIPAEVRKAMGIEPKSVMILSQEDGALRLVPGEVVPKRRIRMIPREEIAQGMIDGAITEEGVRVAKEVIAGLGLNPDDFTSRY